MDVNYIITNTTFVLNIIDMPKTQIVTNTTITGESACDLIVSRQEKERKNFTKPKKSYGDIINILINELAEIKNGK